MPDSKPVTPRACVALEHAWQRAQMHVRCGLAVDRPSWVRVYLCAGAQLVRRGARPALTMHLHMLQTLLRTAQDEALPGFWRSVCLEHAHRPLAHLNAELGPHDPIALLAIEAAVQRARDSLPPLMPAPSLFAAPPSRARP